MTLRQRITVIREWWPLILVAAGAIASVLMIFAVGLWTVYGASLIERARVELGIAELADQVRELAGENRVIRQMAGQSYVIEPVRVGDKVVLNIVAQRTTLGASCRLIGGQSLFTDEDGITVPGSALAARRQIDAMPTRLRVTLDPPPDLMPGRVEVYLSLEYDCGGKTVFDRTDTLVYRLMEAEE